MNHLGIIGAVIGTVAAFLSILAYLNKGIRYNKARSRAQQGRIDCLFRVLQIQSERFTNIEKELSKRNGGEDWESNSGLIKLESEAFEEYKEHDTKLT